MRKPQPIHPPTHLPRETYNSKVSFQTSQAYLSPSIHLSITQYHATNKPLFSLPLPNSTASTAPSPPPHY